MLMRKLVFLYMVMLLTLFSNAYASHPHQYQVVNGIAVYLTIMPAEMLRGHPKEHLESEMHSQSRIEGTNQHHIVVSLFNAKSGERLKDAAINVKVSGINFNGPVRQLELMIMSGIRSYGHFFNMPLAGAYQVELEIQTAETDEVVKVVFQYASI